MAYIEPVEERERQRGRLMSLSAIGAAIAGVGVGVAFASALRAAMWPLVLIGLVVHLWGMVGAHRLNAAAYRPSRAELIGYWVCWVIIGVGAIYVLRSVVL
jgi:hypothetical protein